MFLMTYLVFYSDIKLIYMIFLPIIIEVNIEFDQFVIFCEFQSSHHLIFQIINHMLKAKLIAIKFKMKSMWRI